MKFLTRQEELVLLAVYSTNSETTLKEIRKYLVRQTSKDWSISSVYVPLDRLTENGYLFARVGEPSSVQGGRAKKYYRISENGVKALSELRELNKTMWKPIDGLAY